MTDEKIICPNCHRKFDNTMFGIEGMAAHDCETGEQPDCTGRIVC